MKARFSDPKRAERLLMQQEWEFADTIRELREAAEAAASTASAKVADEEEDAAIDASWKARLNR